MVIVTFVWRVLDGTTTSRFKCQLDSFIFSWNSAVLLLTVLLKSQVDSITVGFHSFLYLYLWASFFYGYLQLFCGLKWFLPNTLWLLVLVDPMWSGTMLIFCVYIAFSAHKIPSVIALWDRAAEWNVFKQLRTLWLLGNWSLVFLGTEIPIPKVCHQAV